MAQEPPGFVVGDDGHLSDASLAGQEGYLGGLGGWWFLVGGLLGIAKGLASLFHLVPDLFGKVRTEPSSEEGPAARDEDPPNFVPGAGQVVPQVHGVAAHHEVDCAVPQGEVLRPAEQDQKRHRGGSGGCCRLSAGDHGRVFVEEDACSQAVVQEGQQPLAGSPAEVEDGPAAQIVGNTAADGIGEDGEDRSQGLLTLRDVGIGKTALAGGVAAVHGAGVQDQPAMRFPAAKTRTTTITSQGQK